jgi:hypothetical protein
MTTSIVFDTSGKCSDTNVNDISFLPTSDTNYNSEWLSDPTASRNSLQGLRYLKTRETGNQIVAPNTSGRDEGMNVSFNNYSYDELAARRKEEVLKYYNTSCSSNKRSKKASYSYYSRSGSISNSRIKKLKEIQNCKTTNSVPFYSSL